MTGMKLWKVSVAEACASGNVEAIRGYMRYVVEPSMKALTEHAETLAASDDLARQVFDGLNHGAVIETTSRALCLGLQSLWEQQLRSILGHWARQQEANRGIRNKIISNKWSEVASAFRDLRGVCLESFGAHGRLELLRQLASVCRHGEGRSARELRQSHPEWLLDMPKSNVPGPVMAISIERLRFLAYGVLHFWTELDLLAMETLQAGGGGHETRITYLKRQMEALA